MIDLHESMGPGRDRTRDPWICSQTRICCQTRYQLRYAAWCHTDNHFFSSHTYNDDDDDDDEHVFMIHTYDDDDDEHFFMSHTDDDDDDDDDEHFFHEPYI